MAENWKLVEEMLTAYREVPCTWGRSHDHHEIDSAIAALQPSSEGAVQAVNLLVAAGIVPQDKADEAMAIAAKLTPNWPDFPNRKNAQEHFAEYFRLNYPGPHTIIGDPNWHAPRIFRAACYALRSAQVDGAIGGESSTPEASQ